MLLGAIKVPGISESSDPTIKETNLNQNQNLNQKDELSLNRVVFNNNLEQVCSNFENDVDSFSTQY